MVKQNLIKRGLLAVFFLAQLLPVGHSFAQDAASITEQTMSNIHPTGDTSFTMVIFKCPPGTGSCALSDGEDKTSLSLYLADYKEDQSEPPKTVVQMREPKKIKGQLILYETDRIWMYFPNTRRAIRIPPEQTLLGDVDVGALLNVDYRFNHSQKLLGEDEETFHLEYISSNGTRTLMYISKRQLVPLSAEYFAPSGRQIRSAVFSDFTLYNGGLMPARIDFVSHIANKNRGGVTSIMITEELGIKLPKILLSPTQLPNFHKRIR
jgi:hypothetical protein